MRGAGDGWEWEKVFRKNKKIKKPVKKTGDEVRNYIRKRGKRKCAQTHGLHKRYFEFFIDEE